MGEGGGVGEGVRVVWSFLMELRLRLMEVDDGK